MADINGVEADDRDEEAHVRLSEAAADEVVLAREHLLKPVEGREERHNSGLVRLLGRRKPGFVHAIYTGRGAVSTGGARGAGRRVGDEREGGTHC